MIRHAAQTIVLCLVALATLTGCDRKSPSAAGTTEKSTERPQIVVDRLQRSVQLDRPAQRIVSLAPATTELLFALGLGDRIVGATTYCNYPKQALSIPRVGGGTLESLSSETIVSLKPDLVLCNWDSHQSLLDVLERLGIKVCAIGAQSLEELYEETRWIGRLAHVNEAAEQFVSRMDARHSVLKSVVSSFEQDPPLRVFYEVWDEPLMTAAPNSFIGEVLAEAGLENILSDTTTRYPRISSETVIEGNPDLILAPTSHFEEVEIESFRSRPGWASISAVANERIYLISGDEVSRCGPRLLDALSEIIVVAYPGAAEQVFGKPTEPEELR
ncbi:MAG: helical backbone metal receptor [Planctomycetota bacterium]